MPRMFLGLIFWIGYTISILPMFPDSVTSENDVILALIVWIVLFLILLYQSHLYDKEVKEVQERIRESILGSMEIDSATVVLLYILSFFIPLAGFIVGAIYASKEEGHYKHVGKNCLIFSVMNIIFGFIMIVVILGSM